MALPSSALLLPGQLRELVETLPVLLLLLLLCGLDWALYSIFDTIRHHSSCSTPSAVSPAPTPGSRPKETTPGELPPLCSHPTPILPILKALLYLAA